MRAALGEAKRTRLWDLHGFASSHDRDPVRRSRPRSVYGCRSRIASEIHEKGHALTVRWVLRRRGVTGNYITEAYESREATERISASFLKRRADLRSPRTQANPSNRHEGHSEQVLPALQDHSTGAPFLKGKWEWVGSESCWWCSKGRQSREHLFKECKE